MHRLSNLMSRPYFVFVAKKISKYLKAGDLGLTHDIFKDTLNI